ncbi:MAG: SsrA-binding protein SmpB [bacterium]
MKNDGLKVVATNRQARRNFEILETHEAGIALSGSEIKSVRKGKIVLRDGYVAVRRGELFLRGVHIAPYAQAAGFFGHDPFRDRKLLMHRKEIDSLYGKVQRKGLTMVPLRVYIKRERAKLEIGLARGKKKFDKKRDIIERELKREADRAMKRKE